MERTYTYLASGCSGERIFGDQGNRAEYEMSCGGRRDDMVARDLSFLLAQ